MDDNIIIHVSDWNMRDKVITVPRVAALDILTESSLDPKSKATKLWDLGMADYENRVNSDPRASEMDEAELFFDWPMTVFGDPADARWEADLQEQIAELEE